RLNGGGADPVLVVDCVEVVGLLGTHELLTVLVPELQRRWPPRPRRLLAALGASDRTPPALPAALALARRHRARLILLHVLPPLRRGLAAELGQDVLDRIVDQRCADARQWLAASVPEGFEATVAVTEG